MQPVQARMLLVFSLKKMLLVDHMARIQFDYAVQFITAPIATSCYAR